MITVTLEIHGRKREVKIDFLDYESFKWKNYGAYLTQRQSSQCYAFYIQHLGFHIAAKKAELERGESIGLLVGIL